MCSPHILPIYVSYFDASTIAGISSICGLASNGYQIIVIHCLWLYAFTVVSNFLYKKQAGAMRVKNGVFSTLFVAGLVCLLWGFWIPAKAVLAQILLQRTWHISLETGQPVKPWPWADRWPIGRLRQPRLGVDLIVLEGASGEALAFGPGRLEGSGQLSENKHSVLGGHRDTSFIFLKNVQSGDKIIVESLTSQDTYTVESAQIVSADELYLDREKSQTLSLITCYPFDSVLPQTTMRYLVTASGATRAITTSKQNFLVDRRLLKAPFVRTGFIPVAGNNHRISHQDLLHGL